MDSRMIRIVVAGREQAGLIADVSRETFYDSFASQNTPENMDKFMTTQFSREMLMKEVGDPRHVFLIAYNGKLVSGYAKLQQSENPPGLPATPAIEISRIYVVKEEIGTGVGSMLMQRCLDISREMGKQAIWLGVWEHNHKAISFYRKWKFEKFGDHVFILGDDPQRDWLMSRGI